MGREERIPRRNRAGNKTSDQWRRAAPFSEKVPGLFRRAAQSVSGFSGRRREKTERIPSTKAKERDKAPFFSRKRRFAKSGIQPNTFRRNRFPTEKRANSTDYKHTWGNFVIPRRGGESANLRRKTTQNATDFVIPAEAKKDFFDKRQSSAKKGWNVRISTPRRRPLLSFFIRLLRKKARFPDF